MPSLTIYGDFNCPFSALASVRADLLVASGGYQVEWRAVQHDTAIPAVGDPVEDETASELAAEVTKIRELSAQDVHLELTVPAVRSNTAAASVPPSPRLATTPTSCAADSSPPYGQRAATSEIRPSSIASAPPIATRSSPAGGRPGSTPCPSRSPRAWCCRMDTCPEASERSPASPTSSPRPGRHDHVTDDFDARVAAMAIGAAGSC